MSLKWQTIEILKYKLYSITGHVKRLCHTSYSILLLKDIKTTNHQILFWCLHLFVCLKGALQHPRTNKLCRPARSLNTLLLVHLRQAEVPAHIVMEDVSSWLVACSSKIPQGEAVEGRNQGRWGSCQPDQRAKLTDGPGGWSRMLSWCSVWRKQTTPWWGRTRP